MELREKPDGDRRLVKRVLPKRLFARLSERKVRRLAMQAVLIETWLEYRDYARLERGEIESGKERYLNCASGWWGARLTLRTFLRWTSRYLERGLGALIDNRGRERGTWPVDGVLWRELCKLLKRGWDVKAAHARLSRRAAREGRKWRSLRTIQQRVQDGRVNLSLMRRAR